MAPRRVRISLAPWILFGLGAAGISGGCYYDKFTKVDEIDDEGSGGQQPASGGEGGTENQGGEPGSGGTPVSEVAVAVDDADVINQGGDTVIDLLENDMGPGIHFISADDTDPTRPSSMDAINFSVSSRGVLTFEPASAFWGRYRASYVIEDENGEQSSADISILVLPETISLATIEAGYGGIVVQGETGDNLGFSIAGAGDPNADGIDDFIIGAPGTGTVAGRAVLVMGASNLGNLDLSTDVSDRAQIFNGANATGTHRAGASVARAGKVNGDAVDDIVIGAAVPASAEFGRVYVIYGSSTLPSSPITLGDSPAANVGFTLTSSGIDFRIGNTVSGGHDLDADGSDDIVLYSPANGNRIYGEFGTTSGDITASFDLSCQTSNNVPALTIVGDIFGADNRAEVLTASNTAVVLLRGALSWPADTDGPLSPAEGWREPVSSPPGAAQVTTAGLFNGDALVDVAYCDPSNFCRIVPTTASPDDYDLGEGWQIGGFGANGPRLSGGGDIDGDGLADVIFAEDSMAYVVYGREPLPTTPLDVSSLSSAGFTIDPGTHTISRVSILGDVNDDGYADYAMTVPDQEVDKGRVYVIFGTPTSN